MNTTYKAFVAETAAKVAAQISREFVYTNDVSLLTDDSKAEEVAISAVNVADKLAAKLEDWWRSKGDHSTVIFDVEDTPLTRLENAVYHLAYKFDDTDGYLANISKALSDKGDAELDPIHQIAESLYKMQGDTYGMEASLETIAEKE